MAASLNNLAVLYDNQGRYAEAEPLYERALAIQEEVLGAEHPDVAVSLNNLAALYYAQGRYAEAEPLYERALGVGEKVFGLIDEQEVPVQLTAVVQAAVREYLGERGYLETSSPLRIRPAERGSGQKDVSISHDRYLASK